MPEVSSFDFARLAALKQYSDLEAEMCQVLRFALGTDFETAETVFYHISNASSRYAIIRSLLTRREEGRYAIAWERIKGWLTQCDGSRNELVHWNESSRLVITLKSQNPIEIAEFHEQPMLKNPKSRSAASQAHYEEDVWNKRDEMRVVLHIVNRFSLTMAEPSVWPWQSAFSQKIIDQTPTNFLQGLNALGYPASTPPYERIQLPKYARNEDRRPTVDVRS